MPTVIRVTYELEPTAAAAQLALRASTGMPCADDRVSGRVVSQDGGRVVLEFPAANWGSNVALILSSLVAGEAMELRALTRCRLVALDLPAGLLPGPAFGAEEAFGGERRNGVGLIVKPSLGLAPQAVGDVARAAAAAGADLLKDDEILGDPSWCPLEERIRAVAEARGGDAMVYCPNITGASTTLLERARRAIELGASGLMINAFAQGLGSLLALREAQLGVPLFAHRVVSGPLVRNERFGACGAVLVRLTRLCGADYVLAGGFGGSLFDTVDEVRANVGAARDRCGDTKPAVAVLGGGVGPDTAVAQLRHAEGEGLLVMLGSAAYRHEDGLQGAVAAAVAAVRSATN